MQIIKCLNLWVLMNSILSRIDCHLTRRYCNQNVRNSLSTFEYHIISNFEIVLLCADTEDDVKKFIGESER